MKIQLFLSFVLVVIFFSSSAVAQPRKGFTLNGRREYLNPDTPFRDLTSIGLRHNSLGEALPPLEGWRVKITCEVVKATGKIKVCEGDETQPGYAIALLRSREAWYDLSSVDLTGTRPILVERNIDIKPSDRLVISQEQALAARLVSDIAWTEKLPEDVAVETYPERAARLGRGGKVVLLCQIQSDGSLACPVVVAEPAGFGFENSARMAVRYFRAPLVLANGQPSMGSWVQVPIRYELRLL